MKPASCSFPTRLLPAFVYQHQMRCASCLKIGWLWQPVLWAARSINTNQHWTFCSTSFHRSYAGFNDFSQCFCEVLINWENKLWAWARSFCKSYESQTEEWGILRPFSEAGCPGAHSEHGRGHRESSGIADGGSAQNTEPGNTRWPQGEHVPQDNLSLLAVTWKTSNSKQILAQMSHSVLFSSPEAKPELLFCSLWWNEAGPDFLYYIPISQLRVAWLEIVLS